MYHLLSGRPPFEADEPLALALMHLQETPQPLDRVRNKRDATGKPDLDEWLIAIVDRLMSKPVEARFQTPDELINAIRDQSPTVRLDNLGPGTAAATIRLQRATDQATRQGNGRSFRWVLGIGLPVLCTLSAAWLSFGTDGKTVDDILRPQTVAQAATVQEQYVNAVIRDDEIGWQSVGQYFPPSQSSTNAGYFAKSQLQLSRLFQENGQLSEADAILRDLRADPNVDRIYQAIALARRYAILQAMGQDQAMAAVKQQFQSLFSDLEASNPAVLFELGRVVSKREMLELGVGDQ